MKKLLTLAAFVLAASMVQAAAVNWSVAGNTFGKSPDDTSSNARAKGYDVYAFLASDYDDVIAALDSGDLDSALEKKAAECLDLDALLELAEGAPDLELETGEAALPAER